MSIIDIYEASIILGVPEFLVRDLVKYGFNQRKLKVVDTGSAAYQFSIDEIQDFHSHLEAPWSSDGDNRSSIPDHIKRYLKYEAQGVCALCQKGKPHYEYAHIRPWAKSHCHSPHNILYLCLDCHTSYGNDIKLLIGLKEEKLRRIRLLDSDFIYNCAEDMISGEAIYVFNGDACRADARYKDKIATGFIKTKVGNNRCTVQRYGVAVIGELQPGEDYFLSAGVPGKIVTYQEFEATRNPTVESRIQRVGRAESNKHLAITFGEAVLIL